MWVYMKIKILYLRHFFYIIKLRYYKKHIKELSSINKLKKYQYQKSKIIILI